MQRKYFKPWWNSMSNVFVSIVLNLTLHPICNWWNRSQLWISCAYKTALLILLRINILQFDKKWNIFKLIQLIPVLKLVLLNILEMINRDFLKWPPLAIITLLVLCVNVDTLKNSFDLLDFESIKHDSFTMR